MSALLFPFDRARAFADVVVHPTQELPHPTLFRGGPEWPRFEAQILARQCWGRIPRPVDRRPHPATPEWPYFDRERWLNAAYAPRRRWRPLVAAAPRRPPAAWLDRADCGVWCGPVHEHFGVMITEYAMRIAAAGCLDPLPLVFSLPPLADAEPAPFFWRIIDHFGIDRRRVMLIKKPTRFGRLLVCPQAERTNGGAPSRRYLRLLDRLSGPPRPPDPADPAVFVSRSRLGRGNFAGEAYLDTVMAAAGLRVFHPQEADLAEQLRLYREAPRLVFSEGSALHGLQLVGHVAADIVVLARRPGNRLAEASVRPRARALRYLNVTLGMVHGLNRLGQESHAKGVSVLDEGRLVASLATVGIDIARLWEPAAYAAQRDADIAAWVADRLAAPAHPGERTTVEHSLAALSLAHLQT